MHITHHDDNQINISYLCIRTFTKKNNYINDAKKIKNKKKAKKKKKNQQNINLSLNSGKLKTRERFCSV